MEKLARAFRVLGFGVIGLSVVGTIIGVVQSCVAMSASGLSSADRARIEAAGTAEALYNVGFGVVVGVALLLASRWASRRAKPRPR
jgi:hypothetical protein